MAKAKKAAEKKEEGCSTCSSCIKCVVMGAVLLLVGAVGGYYYQNWCSNSQIQAHKEVAATFLSNMKPDGKENLKAMFTEDAEIRFGNKTTDVTTFLEGGEVEENLTMEPFLDKLLDFKFDQKDMVVEDDTLCAKTQATQQMKSMFNTTKIKSTSFLCMEIKDGKVSVLDYGDSELLED